MRKWTVVGAWLAAVAAALVVGGPVPDNDETHWMPADVQSTEAVRLAQREFPGQDASALVVVYERRTGIVAGDLAKAERDRQSLRRWADGAVLGPVRSDDGQAMMVTAPIAAARLRSGSVGDAVDQVRQVVDRDLPAGLTALVTGGAAGRADAMAANGRVDVALTVVTIAVVAMILLVVYRSFVQMILPLICVGCAVVVAQAVASLRSVVSGSAFVVMIVLVFGMGTDYALLLMARYREELIRLTADRPGLLTRSERAAAMQVAVRASAPAIGTSAATMVLASLALLAADMNSTADLGPVAAIAVGAATTVMLTLLPVLLVMAAPRVERRARGRMWEGIAERVAAQPRRAGAAAAVGLAALAAVVPWISVGSLAGADNFVQPPPSVLGQKLLQAHFPAGSAPAIIVYAPAGQADAVADRVRQIGGIGQVRMGLRSVDGQWQRLEATVSEVSGRSAATDEPRQDQLVADVRTAAGAAAIVGGPVAERVDRDAAMDRDLLVVGVLVAVVVGVMVGWLLRSAKAAVVVLGATLLSAAAALGASSLLFRALGFARIDPTVLTLGYLFLIALGVDYTIFLLARARHDGVRRALASTGGVISSAGLVLAATFLVLTITPVVINIQLGLLVAIGVLLDTMVVRTVLIPAVVTGIGWPPHGSGSGNPD